MIGKNAEKTLLEGKIEVAPLLQSNVIPSPKKVKVLDGQLTLTNKTPIQYKNVKDNNAIKDGGYRLTVNPDGITVVSSGDAGRFMPTKPLSNFSPKAKRLTALKLTTNPDSFGEV
jgi:hypothetical protein